MGISCESMYMILPFLSNVYPYFLVTFLEKLLRLPSVNLLLITANSSNNTLDFQLGSKAFG